MKPWQMLFAPPLALLSFFYAGMMKVRAWFYHVGVFPSDSSGAFVVSIGNLQAGGTGKTPVAAFFAERWRQKTRLGIVSRGYGRKTRGSLRVDPTEKFAAKKFGDEPSWLAARFDTKDESNVPVQVGERRLEAARDLIISEGLKLVLLDDGFQHMHLRRSYDIVLVDVSAPSWHWRVLPWGRLREPVSALRRADAIILTKTESTSKKRVASLEEQVRRWAAHGSTGQPIILHFEQRLEWAGEISGEKLILAAGLASPESFFDLVRAHRSKPDVREVFAFNDHHDYTAEDVERLVRSARRHSARLLVTEKDAVKLRSLWLGHEDTALVVSSLDVRPVREFDEKQLERMDEAIFGQMRGTSGARGKLPSR